MRKYATVLFSSTIVLASGCAVIGYRAPEGVPVAKINIKSEGNKWICISGERHNLRAESEGYADIPAGNRVTIGSRYNNYVYGGISTSCNPSSSIIPKAGQRYYIDFDFDSKRCYALIFKEDPGSRSGLALDPTFGPSSDCLGK